MYRVASASAMCAELKVDRKVALLIRRIAKAVDYRDELKRLITKHCPKTAAYAASCYNDPFSGRNWRVHMVLEACDELLGTCGVEPLGRVHMYDGPPYLYCNAGDPYVATLVYTRETDTLRVASWGDIVERHPKLFREDES